MKKPGETDHKYRERRATMNRRIDGHLKGRYIKPHFGPNRKQKRIAQKMARMNTRGGRRG